MASTALTADFVAREALRYILMLVPALESIAIVEVTGPEVNARVWSPLSDRSKLVSLSLEGLPLGKPWLHAEFDTRDEIRRRVRLAMGWNEEFIREAMWLFHERSSKHPIASVIDGSYREMPL